MSPLADPERSVVVIIDMQGRLMDLVHRGEMMRRATVRLLELAELFGVPVVLTEQYPRGLGPTHPEILEAFDRLTGAKRRIEKESFSCCGSPAFEAALSELRPGLAPGDRQLIIGGIEAHICVVQSVVELRREGTSILVCWECVSGRGEEYRRHALERMQQAGAALTNHESVAFEWARDKNHPRFREVSRLLREGQIG